MNDELNNVFNKYDRYMANRRKEQEQRAQGGAADAGALIDFGAGSNASAGNADLTQKMGELSKDFFRVVMLPAPHKSVFLDVSGGPAGATGAQPAAQGGAAAVPVKESDVKEMEAWLKQSVSASVASCLLQACSRA